MKEIAKMLAILHNITANYRPKILKKKGMNDVESVVLNLFKANKIAEDNKYDISQTVFYIENRLK